MANALTRQYLFCTCKVSVRYQHDTGTTPIPMPLQDDDSAYYQISSMQGPYQHNADTRARQHQQNTIHMPRQNQQITDAVRVQ